MRQAWTGRQRWSSFRPSSFRCRIVACLRPARARGCNHWPDAFESALLGARARVELECGFDPGSASVSGCFVCAPFGRGRQPSSAFAGDGLQALSARSGELAMRRHANRFSRVRTSHDGVGRVAARTRHKRAGCARPPIKVRFACRTLSVVRHSTTPQGPSGQT